MTGLPAFSAADLRKSLADMGRISTRNGVDEARFVTLGGARQWITVRGLDRRAPLLLFLHGGPGGAISAISHLFQRPWEDYFTVVQWDQRGFGRSAIDGARLEGTITLDQCVADGIELIDLLRADHGQARVVLMGQSWGTVLGLEIAKRRPDLLHVLVSLGQNVDWRGNFEETRRLLVGHARKHDEKEFLEKLEGLGPLPSRDDVDAWTDWVGFVQGNMVQRGYSWRNYVGPGDWNERIVPFLLASPMSELPPAEPDPPFSGGPATPFGEIAASVEDWTARGDVGTRFEVPVVIMAGAHDWQTPVTLARAYYEEVDAPWKAWVEFPHSAHVMTMEEPGRMIVTLVEKVLPAVEGRVPAGVERRAPNA